MIGHTKYDTIRDAVLTSAQKVTPVSLIYRMEPTTKKWKTEKLKSKKTDMLRSIGKIGRQPFDMARSTTGMHPTYKHPIIVALLFTCSTSFLMLTPNQQHPNNEWFMKQVITTKTAKNTAVVHAHNVNMQCDINSSDSTKIKIEHQ